MAGIYGPHWPGIVAEEVKQQFTILLEMRGQPNLNFTQYRETREAISGICLLAPTNEHVSLA